MLAALAARRPIETCVALVVAHPDDETIAIGGSIHLLRRLLLIHVTDGAPPALDDAARRGFATSADYARARADELDRALARHAGPIERAILEIPDQAAMHHVGEIGAEVARLCSRHGAGHVMTHAFEGGHPDHDAVALAVHRVAADVIEFAGYHRALEGGMRTSRFLPAEGAPSTGTVQAELSEADRARKAAMTACFASQAGILSQFDPAIERFRAAPRYDFAVRPHPGRLLYEEWGWLDFDAWRTACGV